MRAIQSRDRQILCSAFLLTFAGMASGCGQPPYALSAPEVTGVTQDPANPSPVGAPAAAEDPGLIPKPELPITGIKPQVPGKPILGLPHPETGTYLTPQARVNKRRAKRMWNPEWDAYIEAALTPRMLSNEVPADVKSVCPRFFQLSTQQMKTFWAYFFQAVAVPESGFSLSKRFLEKGIRKPDLVTGLPNYSEGLLQLSYQDARLHGCDFNWKADLANKGTGKLASIHQPRSNLECGVKILNKQLFGQRAPRTLFTYPRAYYWSVLVKDSDGYKEVIKQLEGVPSFCKQAE